ncbi:MAG: SlyX protein [Parasphingorhabdus sp.]|jgi:SlyX protein
MTDNTISRIDELENKFAFQEQLVETLNDLIIEQQNRLQALEKKNQEFATKLTTIIAQSGLDIQEVEQPPHY